MGELSRKRIEQITCKSIGSLNIDTDKEQMSILRGRAGTGKTVGLIQTAIRLVDEQNLRVIILTYNKALVSDIRRLFALAELPDMFQEQCVSINTMHSFFYQIISKGIYDGNLDGEAFIKDYQKYLVELLDFLNSDDDSITVITIRDIFNKKHDEINIVTQYILKIKQKQHFNNNLILSVF